ncbi:MAG: response regulator, partial [Hyphomicrobiales bacterium]
IQVGPEKFGIVVDNVFDTEEIVVKPLASMLRDIAMFSGNTILGDGSVVMIVDPNGIAQAVCGRVSTEAARDEDDVDAALDVSDKAVPMLVFRAGSSEPKAVPLSLITRLEEIDAADIELSNGSELVQYRGRLMPLVRVQDAGPGTEGVQPVLVFADQDQVMGLVIDEIVDIVEERLDIEIATDRADMIGSAVIAGRATEIIDVGHYLMQVFDDWFSRGSAGSGPTVRRVLLVDDSPFFRDMLAPVLSAGGFTVTAVASAVDALKLRDNGTCFDVIVSDIEMPDMDGFAFAEAVASDTKWANTPIIALSSRPSSDLIERARRANFADYVGKFDREGLIDVLKQTVQPVEAAA